MHALIILAAVLNVLLAGWLFIKKNDQGSPFQFFFLAINAFFLCPAVFDQPGTVVDWHPFANPILLTEDNLFRAHLITFTILSIFTCLEFVLPNKGRFNVTESEAYFGVFKSAPVALFVLSILTWLLYGQRLFEANFVTSREGALGLFPLLTAYAALFVIPLPYMAIRQKRYLLSMLCLVALAVPALIFGGARQMFLVGLALVFLGFFPIILTKGSWLLLVTCCGMPLIEIIANIFKKVRNLSSLTDRLSYLSTELFADLFGGHLRDFSEGESRIRFIFYDICSGLHIDGGGQFLYLRRTMLAWMPSRLDVFSIKPDDFEKNIWNAIMNIPGGTTHPTFMGTVYADAGWLFPIWVFVIFFMMRIIENLIRSRSKYSLYLWLLSCFAGMMWARGTIYGVTVLMLPVIFWLLYEMWFLRQQDFAQEIKS